MWILSQRRCVDMNRLSFRPRPLDIHKKLPIVKSIKEFEDDDAPTATSTRSSQSQRIVAEGGNEVHETTNKKVGSEIPIPRFVVVDTYERDYACTFRQPTSYVRGRGAKAEVGHFVEYDLDNEDEDWLQEFNNEGKILSPEKFESLLFKLEVLDHKTRERAGIIAPTFGSPVPVLVQLDSAIEALQLQSIRYAVFQSVYNHWKKKRERWRKPILRHLQPPPPLNDTNPYNVFRPREKAHRLHTRRLQRRENNVLSFEKLRQVWCKLEQAKVILDTLIKREEKKREVMESEVSLQRIQMKYKHEAQLIEDGLALAGFPSLSCKFRFAEDFVDSCDMATHHVQNQPTTVQKRSFMDYKVTVVPRGHMTRELKWQLVTHGYQERDSHEPVLLFTKPLAPEKLAAAGIVAPSSPLIENGSVLPPYQFHGRIGRGGRVIFDRQKNTRHG